MAGGNGADENLRSFIITAQFVPKLCLLFQGVLESCEIQALNSTRGRREKRDPPIDVYFSINTFVCLAVCLSVGHAIAFTILIQVSMSSVVLIPDKAK